MGGIDWGDAPTWLGAVFAAMAAAAAVWTLKSQRDQIDEQRDFIRQQSENLALERAELRAVADDRKREQASQVKIAAHVFRRDENGYDDEMRWYVVVKNESDAPIFSLQVTLGAAGNAVEVSEARYNRAYGYTTAGRRTTPPLEVAGAGKLYRFCSEIMDREEGAANRPVLLFTDEAGVRWSLDGHGKLEEVTADRPGE
ncbi:hypothetical protein L7D48_13475 [Streptomyces sp. S1A]|uniref:hypothetical protein n=1 Tax=Streptomyces sp. ICN903 TaxID=2964654 RepID=UPI001EDB839D|nr:hypothetical protein [Streptomyces sp. ICN903]MCG3041560.1 hypothetical protein [Streptomyces sp. ICN903]